MQKEIMLETSDSLSVAATVFMPEDKPKAGIIINSATAVKQGYYRAFALFLVQRGYMVITYDYRGIGRSAVHNSRDERLTMQAWGEKDLAVVIEWASASHGDLDWHCVGHSVGGQILGLARNNSFFKSVYCVSAQSGYWANWERLGKPRLFVMWYSIVPFLSTLFGKVPGVFLGGEALPERIAKQWAYWGRHPQYIVDGRGKPIREGFHNISCDMKFLLIDDDTDFAPPKAVRQLAGFYQNANIHLETISAKKVGTKIGHFGFFRTRHENDLWLDALQWVDSKYSAEVGPAI